MTNLDQAEMRQFFDRIPVLVMLVDREYRFRYVNPAYHRLLNRPVDQIIGKTIREIRGDAFFEQIVPQVDAALKGETISCEVNAIQLEPTPWFESRYFPHMNGNGEIDGVYIVGVEITERKSLEEAIRANQTRYELALEIGGIGVWEWDLRSGTSAWDRRMEEMFGFEPSEYDGTFETYVKMLHPEDAEKQVAYISQISENGSADIPPHNVFRIFPKTGGMRWIKSLWVPRTDSDGQITGGIGTLIDITDWKDAEERQAQDQRRLQELLHETQEKSRILEGVERIAHLGSWHWDDARQEMFWSDSMYGIYGRDPSLGPPTRVEWRRLVIDEDRDHLIGVVENSLNRREGYVLDYRIRHGVSGEIRCLHSEVEVATDGDGHARLLGMVQDVTTYRELEDKIRSSESRQRLALELGGIGVWEWDASDGTSVYDAQTEKILGFDPGEYDGRVESFFQRLHPDDVQAQRAVIDACLTSGPTDSHYHSVFRILTPAGELRWIETLWSPQFDRDNQFAGGIGTLIDVTTRKLAEERLLENQRRLEELLHEMEEKSKILNEAERIAQIASWQYDDDRKEFFGSDNMYRLYGRDPALGAPPPRELANYIHEDDRERVFATMGCALKDGSNYTVDYRIVHGLTGDVRHIHSEVEVSTTPSGHRKLMGSVQDVTERIEAAKKLQESEALLRQIIDTSPNSIFIKDREGRYLLVSKHMARSHGMTPEELIGKSDRDVARNWLEDRRFAEHRESELAVIDQKRPLYIPESEFVFANGSHRWFQTTKLPFSFDGDPDCILVISVDITERKLAEEQLRLANESLREERTALEEKNVTLKTLLEHLQETRDEYRKKICEDIRRTILPAVEKLRQKTPKSRELSKVETGLRAITDETGDCKNGDIATLSPREIEICRLIKKGKTSKEIADILSISLQTVHKHRSSIRKKLLLENTSVNLTSYLQSITLP